MSTQPINSFDKKMETETTDQIQQLFLCCFCSQMVNHQSFIFHYAHCKDIFNQEEINDLSIREDIRRLDQMCSFIYYSIESEKNCVIDILEFNKKAKGINSQLASLTNLCPKCETEVLFNEQQFHHSKCSYDTQDHSESSMMTTNSSIILLNSESEKKKRIKKVLAKLKEFATEEAKSFTLFSLHLSALN